LGRELGHEFNFVIYTEDEFRNKGEIADSEADELYAETLEFRTSVLAWLELEGRQ